MADIESLTRLINEFKFESRPSNADANAPCTVGDLNKLIDKLAEVLQAIVNAMNQR